MDEQKPLITSNSIEGRVKLPKLNRTGVSLTVLGVIALMCLIYSGMAWRQNKDLNSQVTLQNAKIKNLTESLAAMRKASSSTAAQPKPQTTSGSTLQSPITGKIGEIIETDSGSLTVNSYQKTSLHDINPGNYSTDPILEVTITLKNSTSSVQNYDWRQFTLVNSNSKIIGNKSGENGYGLNTVTFEPGGSTETKLFFYQYDSQQFYGYDSKQSTLRWNNSAGQEVQVVLPAL